MPKLTHALSDSRVSLGFFPTPLEPMPRLSRHLGDVEIWVKRDDCTGLGVGGNKTRKLELLVAMALKEGADTLVTSGALQSNHARQTAAAAAKLGLHCVLPLIAGVPGRAPGYATSGNMLLDDLFDADVRVFPDGSDMEAEIAAIMDELQRAGRKPYLIPVGGSNAIGSLAYADAMAEMADQAAGLGVDFDRIYMPTGSGGTQTGMVVGAGCLGLSAAVTGISISGTVEEMVEKLTPLVAETMALVTGSNAAPAPIIVDDAYVGDGYGQPTDGMIEAVRTTARLEGLLLDPVYTGKAMAGLFDHIRSGKLPAGSRVLFWHTGGSPGLFAYEECFARQSDPALAAV